MNTSDKRALRRAAVLLERVAEDIFVSNTVDGEWDPESGPDKREHKRFIEAAARLRKIAEGTE